MASGSGQSGCSALGRYSDWISESSQDLDDAEDFQLSSDENRERFERTTDRDIEKAIDERVPKKTCQTTKWAVSVFCA